MILAVLIDGEGRPVCSEMWPGNTADVTTLIPVIDRLRRRFAIGRICVVADRGMISTETVAALEERALLYLLGTRERTDKVVRDLVLTDTAPCVPLTAHQARPRDRLRGQGGDRGRSTLHPLPQPPGGRRGMPPRARPSWPTSNVSSPRVTRRWSATPATAASSRAIGHGHFAIDRAKAEEDASFDGVFVLRTNTDLDPLDAMLRYKQLWTVEATFRTAKHLLATRPIFHKLDETIRGHVFCSFLALVLKSELGATHRRARPRRLVAEILADLDSLTETEIDHDGKRFLVRSAPRPPPASRSAPPASPCRRPFRSSTPTDPHVVPCRAHGADCRSRSAT